MIKSISEYHGCPICGTVELLRGKWTISILYTLQKGGKKRFKELERSIEGINTRMLVKEVKFLELNGLISRTVFPTAPPTVEYELTEKGHTLIPILFAMRDWGKVNVLYL